MTYNLVKTARIARRHGTIKTRRYRLIRAAKRHHQSRGASAFYYRAYYSKDRIASATGVAIDSPLFRNAANQLFKLNA